MNRDKIGFGKQLSQTDIDWRQIEVSLDGWIKKMGTSVMNTAASTLGTITSSMDGKVISACFLRFILWKIKKN